MIRRTKAEWLFIIREQKQSGMNMAEFCRANHINKQAFYNARYRFKEEIQEDNVEEPAVEKEIPVSSEKPSFIPVRVQENTTEKSEELPELPDPPLDFMYNRMRLTIPSSISDYNLTRIIRACASI